VAWIVPMWIVLELARGKLLHYPLPLYVGIAILCADALVQGWHRLTDVFAAKWFEGARWVIFVIWLAMAGAVLIGARWTGDMELFWRCIPLAGAFAAAGVAATVAWGRPSWPFVTALGWAAALLVIDTIVLPEIGSIQISRVIGHEMAEMKRADPELVLAAEGYEEPTLVFYAGQKVEMGPRAVQLIDSGGEAGGQRYVAAVDGKTADLLREKKVEFYAVMERRGFNLANQKPVRVMLITNVPPKEPAATRWNAPPPPQREDALRIGG
jgi:4-amino-4-deoxy-L-arabinose transferase-like glycosyltransferase